LSDKKHGAAPTRWEQRLKACPALAEALSEVEGEVEGAVRLIASVKGLRIKKTSLFQSISQELIKRILNNCLTTSLGRRKVSTLSESPTT
jgi:hypothetical protein